MSAEPIISVDGRRARRDQNRERVVDALLDLYREGDLQPSVAAVAERSGVSHRSVFRYFEDLDELYRVAIERQYAAVSDLMHVSRIGEGTVEERIDRLVENRLALYDEAAPVARVGHMRAPTEPVLETHIREMSDRGRQQIHAHFGPEVGDDPVVAEAAAAALSIENLEFLRHIRGLSRAEAGTVVTATLRALLTRDGT